MNRPVLYSLLFLFSALLAAPVVSADGGKIYGQHAGKRSELVIHAPRQYAGKHGYRRLKRYDGVHYFPKRFYHGRHGVRHHYSNQHFYYGRHHYRRHSYH